MISAHLWSHHVSPGTTHVVSDANTSKWDAKMAVYSSDESDLTLLKVALEATAPHTKVEFQNSNPSGK